MSKLILLVAALFLALVSPITGSAYALNMASAGGSVDISTATWIAATVAGAGDGNPQAPFSYTLNNGNGRRAFAYVKSFGSRNLSSVTLSASGGQANRTITVTACFGGSWTGPNTCTGTQSVIMSGPANSATGSVGAIAVGGSVHIRITCPQNVSGQLNTAAI